MKLAISNIAWTEQEDSRVYSLMKKYGYTGLEIAPTRIFERNPYEYLNAVRRWHELFLAETGFDIPSMQSIWYGKTEKLFEDERQRLVLLSYTQKAVNFASAVHCPNLVFGSPKNRTLPDPSDKEMRERGTAFFRKIGAYAKEHGTVIAIEANPVIYDTNYINTTLEAILLIKEVSSEGFLLNLDIGTMIANKEPVETLENNAGLIHHVHISEPYLKPIVMDGGRRSFHGEIAAFLRENNYQGYISIEMGKTQDGLEEILAYGKEMFG